jgi:hypothetical protein
MWPWAAAVTGLLVSVAGNVGHVQPLRGLPVTAADRITAATSPLAAFAGLMIGLLVLKMSNRHLAAEGRESDAGGDQAAVQRLAVTGSPGEALDDAFAGQPGLLVSQRSLLLQDAAEIMEAGRVSGQVVSRRALAAQLRGRGHRFSNAQLGQIADAAPAAGERVA